MEFRSSATGNQKACLPVTNNGDTYLTAWNDWLATNNDYDLFLYDSSLTTILDSSDNDQTAGIVPPTESILAPLSGNGCLVLASFSSTQNHLIHIDVGNNDLDVSVRVRAGSISTPADASGALTVGAVNQETDTLEAFSSSGPTDDNRNKPEICGPDNVLTHQNVLSNLNPFFGTSSATPHVAGAAALLLQETPSLTVDQLRQKLIDEAVFNSGYSQDNLCGSNSGHVSVLVTATTCPPIPASGDWTITYDCELRSNGTVLGNIIVQNNAVLTILNGVTLNIDFTTKYLLVKSGSGVLIKSGGKIT
jgi:subtilisin family serine protease